MDLHFAWLDNEGNQRFAKFSDEERIHNLMQVIMERTGVTWTDRMFFWNAHADACKLLPERERERALQSAVIACA